MARGDRVDTAVLASACLGILESSRNPVLAGVDEAFAERTLKYVLGHTAVTSLDREAAMQAIAILLVEKWEMEHGGLRL